MKGLLLFLLVVSGFNSYANTTKIDQLKCYSERFEYKYNFSLSEFEYNSETKVATVVRFGLSIIVPDNIADVMPFYRVMSVSGSAITNVDHNPRKYKNYLKFDLNAAFATPAFDQWELLILPEYTVVKEELRHRYWDPSDTYTREYREYPAVMPLRLDDHHGDYVPLKCISVVTVRK